MRIHHGGDLSDATVRFGDTADGWVDLSTGINACPWNIGSDFAGSLHRLPDEDQLDRLRLAAATAYGIADISRIVLAAGTQTLIQWMPRLRRKGRVLVISPTYGEHAPAWRAAGHEVHESSGLTNHKNYDVVVVTCPNNPDGRLFRRSVLESVAEGLARRAGLLVIDEAFADVSAEPSLVASIYEGVVALRSFGKFFGIPGLRLGFGITDRTTAQSLKNALGPWPISTLAAEMGVAALGDLQWQSEMRDYLSIASDRMDDLLTRAGLQVVGGTNLFRLAATPDAMNVFEQLGRSGIYTRHFPENPAWLRFGLPGSERHWQRLEMALNL